MTRLSAALAQLRALDRPAAGPAAPATPGSRALLLTTLVFVVVTLSFPRTAVLAMLPLLLYPLWLLSRSRLPLKLLARGWLVALPLVLLAGGFEPWLRPAPVLQWGPLVVSEGALVLAALLLRCLLTVTAVLALVAALGLRQLAAAAQGLGVPALFTEHLLLLHRHAFLMLEEGQRITTAWRLRAGPRRHPPLATWGPLAGQWLLRSLQRARRVHLAMLARGYRGRLPLQPAAAWRWPDTAFVAGWCALFALLRAVDLPTAVGHLIVGA